MEELSFVAVLVDGGGGGLVWCGGLLMEAELKEELCGVWVPLHPELLLSFVNFSARKKKEREERKRKKGWEVRERKDGEKEREREREGKEG